MDRRGSARRAHRPLYAVSPQRKGTRRRGSAKVPDNSDAEPPRKDLPRVHLVNADTLVEMVHSLCEQVAGLLQRVVCVEDQLNQAGVVYSDGSILDVTALGTKIEALAEKQRSQGQETIAAAIEHDLQLKELRSALLQQKQGQVPEVHQHRHGEKSDVASSAVNFCKLLQRDMLEASGDHSRLRRHVNDLELEVSGVKMQLDILRHEVAEQPANPVHETTRLTTAPLSILEGSGDGAAVEALDHRVSMLEALYYDKRMDEPIAPPARKLSTTGPMLVDLMNEERGVEHHVHHGRGHDKKHVAYPDALPVPLAALREGELRQREHRLRVREEEFNRRLASLGLSSPTDLDDMSSPRPVGAGSPHSDRIKTASLDRKEKKRQKAEAKARAEQQVKEEEEREKKLKEEKEREERKEAEKRAEERQAREKAAREELEREKARQAEEARRQAEEAQRKEEQQKREAQEREEAAERQKKEREREERERKKETERREEGKETGPSLASILDTLTRHKEEERKVEKDKENPEEKLAVEILNLSNRSSSSSSGADKDGSSDLTFPESIDQAASPPPAVVTSSTVPRGRGRGLGRPLSLLPTARPTKPAPKYSPKSKAATDAAAVAMRLDLGLDQDDGEDSDPLTL